MDETHISRFACIQNDVGLRGVDQVITRGSGRFGHHVVAGSQLISAGHAAFIGDELCHFLAGQSVVDDVGHVGDGAASLIVRIHNDGALFGIGEGSLCGLVVLNSHCASSGVRHITVGSEHFLNAVLTGLQNLSRGSTIDASGKGFDLSAQRVADDEHRARQGLCGLGVQLLNHDSAMLFSGQNSCARLRGGNLNGRAVNLDSVTIGNTNQLCGVGAGIQVLESDSTVFGGSTRCDFFTLFIDEGHAAACDGCIGSINESRNGHKGSCAVVEVCGSNDASLDLNGLRRIDHHKAIRHRGLSDDVGAVLQGRHQN